MARKFDPTVYRNKKQFNEKLPHQPGICWIWDWVEEKKKYVKREIGLKYYAYKKTQGKQVSKCFEDFSEAKQWRGTAVLDSPKALGKKPLFSEVIEEFFAHKSGKWKVSTEELYRSHLKHLGFFYKLRIDEINHQVIDHWLRLVKKPEYLRGQHITRLSYEQELKLLKQIFTYYREYIDETFIHPCRKKHNEDCIINRSKYNQAKDRSKSKFIQLEDCTRFLNELSSKGAKKPSEWLYFHLGEFQFYSGCRVGEVCALLWSDIDWASSRVHVSKTVQWARSKSRATVISESTKTNRSRWVSLPTNLMKSLKCWQEISGRDSGLIFSHHSIYPVGYREVQYRYDRAFRALGLSWRSSHILRHTFATHWLALSGGSVQSLQSQLGHSTPKQSLHYAKTTEETVHKDLKAFEAGLARVIPISNLTTRLDKAGSSEESKRVTLITERNVSGI